MRTALFVLFLSLTWCQSLRSEEQVTITWASNGVKVEASIPAGQEEAFLRHARAIQALRQTSPSDDPFAISPPDTMTDMRCNRSMDGCLQRLERMHAFIDRLLINDKRLSELVRTLRVLTDELRHLNQNNHPRRHPSSNFNTAL